MHSQVNKFQGSANKNIGDAFLLVWKFPHDDIDSFDNELTLRPDNTRSSIIADLSLVSFLKIIAFISRSSQIRRYGENRELQIRIPNYKVRMGFGLHSGWAIEGAIGSMFKIDASYLSPNVNIASRLEAATKQYGVMILVSGEHRDMMTEEMQGLLREIDRVTVKGS